MVPLLNTIIILEKSTVLNKTKQSKHLNKNREQIKQQHKTPCEAIFVKKIDYFYFDISYVLKTNKRKYKKKHLYTLKKRLEDCII